MENGLPGLAKILIFTGLILLVIGLLVWGLDKFPGIKSLPGDMVFKKKNFTFYFPLGTSILLSILLTLFLYLWKKFSS